ncbi:MAG: tetratricopeptide repeat protein [Xenococcaceae cyanobacterium]
MENGKLANSKTATSRSNEEIEKGKKFQQQGQLLEATNCYHRALELNPLEVEAYQSLAAILKQQGNFNEAALYYRQALELKQYSSALVVLNDREKVSVPTPTTKLNQPFSFHSLADDRRKLPAAIIQFKLESKNYLVSLVLSERNSFAPRSNDDIKEEVRVCLQQALTANEAKNWHEAILACQQALELDPKAAQAYKIMGNALQRSGKAADAMNCYNKAIELQPDLAEVYASIAALYTQQKKWPQAIEHYQKAILINPKLPAIYRNLANVWHQVGEPRKALECTYQAVTLEPEKTFSEQQLILGDRLLKIGKINQAIAYYRRAIETDPQFAPAYQKIAELFEKHQHWQQATAYYRRALQLSEAERKGDFKSNDRLFSSSSEPIALLPDSDEFNLRQLTSIKPVQNLLNSRNQSTPTDRQIKKLKLDRAKPEQILIDRIKEYLDKVEQNPNSASLRVNLGNLYAQQKRWEKALACYDSAIQIDPSLAIAHRNLAKVLQYTGKQQEAIESLYRALELDPKLGNAEEYLQLGHSFLKNGKSKTAIACYRQAIKNAPKIIEAYHCLGEILIEQGQQQEAIDCYYLAIEQNPQDGESYHRLAKTLVANNESIHAISCYRQAIELQGDRFEFHYELAELLTKQARWYEAVRSYYQAIELNPNFPWAHYYLGTVLLKIKRWKKAASSFSKAIELNPNFLWSYYYLAEALIELEDWDGAIAICTRALQHQPDFFEASHQLNQALAQKLIAKIED